MYWSIDIDRDGCNRESDRVVRKSSNVYFRVVINVKFEISQGKISAQGMNLPAAHGVSGLARKPRILTK